MIRGLTYEIVLWLFALAAIPKMLYQRIVHGKYRNCFSKRMGFAFPNIAKEDRELIWVHAVSVGETKAVAALAKKLKESHKNSLLLVSSTTDTGHAEAMRSMPFADYHVYLPLDLYVLMNSIIRRVKPSIVVLSESDYWYNFMRLSKAHGASIFVVNGKISERSTKRFQMVPGFCKELFSFVDFFSIQNQIYADRFASLSVPKEKMVITGNMKFDESYPKLTQEELISWRDQLGIKQTDKVLVVGSTHSPEEKLVLEALIEVWKEIPNLKALIVPRHPERFSEVAGILSKQSVPFIRFSQLNDRTGQESIILTDAMGQLRKCYQLADVALVGGSYTDRVGGHNIIEPCWYGVPVLFGPHMYTQPELVALVKEYKAGLQVNPENLVATLLSLLNDQEKRLSLGRGGIKLMSDMQGATSKTFQAIENQLKNKVSVG
ncbi:MAG: 3-deoxy-D-manno-octulosonic acid transferase [Parachlamydiaceae bacterium]|nr:3-deoxy-D-manno-octulosonic acid transferase [Parachlamydiaceae bacterium]